MNRLMLVIAVAATAMCLMTQDSHAQFGSSSSISTSSSYSSSWGSSQGFGPGGYFNNSYSNEQASGSVTRSNGYSTPWGGGNRGSTQSWGARRSSFQNSGVSPFGGVYNNQGGSFNSFSKGQTWNNNWRW